MTVIEGKEFLIQNAQNSQPIRLPMRLPALEASYGKSALENLKHWKWLHTLAEQSFRDFRELHLGMLAYQRSGDERHRENAAHYLREVVHGFGNFRNEVVGFPETVRAAQPLSIALQINQCFDVLSKSLVFLWHDHEFQNGVHLV